MDNGRIADEAEYEPGTHSRRSSARSQVFMVVRDFDGGEPLWAWDVGLGGMQVQSRQPRWPGTFINVDFTLPGSAESLRVGAQVVSLNKSRDGRTTMGLRFCLMSGAAKMALYRFLDARRALWNQE